MSKQTTKTNKQARQLANNQAEMRKPKYVSGSETVQRADRREFDKMKNGYLDILQSEAADKFEAYFIGTQMNTQAFDPSREPVDGGKAQHEIPDYVIECHNKLGQASRVLGMISYDLVHKFVCEGMTAAQIAVKFNEDPKSDRILRYYRKRFRDALTELADLWMPGKERRTYHDPQNPRLKIDRSNWGKV